MPGLTLGALNFQPGLATLDAIHGGEVGNGGLTLVIGRSTSDF
jgi:hypothetical protein